MLNKLIQMFFPLPSCCVLCGQTASRHYSLCHPCEELLPILSHNCRICAQFLPVSDSICGACLQKKPPFDRTYALFPYEAPIVRMIIKLKFQHDLKIAQLFGELFIKLIQGKYHTTVDPAADKPALWQILYESSLRGHETKRSGRGNPDFNLEVKAGSPRLSASQPRDDEVTTSHKSATTQTRQRDDSLPDLIIPVPLHSMRLRQRGFNQALEIARPINKALNIPIDTQSIWRSKPTLAQSGLPAKLREQNIRHAFASNRRYDGLKIALLDDVVTTGHTVHECSQILKEQGAQEIDVWCVARRG